jgi:glycosyltransferase involved in cell wall biosynthesis
MKTNLNFIYFGRLTSEKGFDLFLKGAIESINQNLNHCFWIFGKGPIPMPLNQNCFVDYSKHSNKQLSKIDSIPNKILYFGQRDFHKVIQPILATKIDYSIVPSRFIETFGLTALESISNAVPVIGPAKGGLAQFILPEHSIQLNQESLLDLVKNLKKPSLTLKNSLIKLSQKYSPTNWLSNVKKIIPKGGKKILLINDFKETIGGTETHILQIQHLLELSGYQVEVIAFPGQPSKINMLKAIFNIKTNQKITKKILEFNPDLIWCHSVSRYIGPLGLNTLKKSKAKKIITIHDLGLFSNQPSKLEQITDIPKQKKKLSFKLKQTLLNNRIIKQINSFDLVLVPSPFILPIIKNSIKTKIQILPHFFSKK